MHKHILIATDGSDQADKGVAKGLDLARAYGAKVTVITVSEPFPAYDLGTKFGLFRDQRAIDIYESNCRKVAEAILGNASEAAAGVECDTLHVPDSTPAKAILETAKVRSCDLIVLTSHGRHGLERLMLGSQASRVVEGAETSVLVVR